MTASPGAHGIERSRLAVILGPETCPACLNPKRSLLHRELCVTRRSTSMPAPAARVAIGKDDLADRQAAELASLRVDRDTWRLTAERVTQDRNRLATANGTLQGRLAAVRSLVASGVDDAGVRGALAALVTEWDKETHE